MPSRSATQDLEDTEASPSPFRAAFGRARVEALAAGGLILEDEPHTTAQGKRSKRKAKRKRAGKATRTKQRAVVARFEYRLERRRGKRSADEADWNELGRRGWELVGVTTKHAAFKRPL